MSDVKEGVERIRSIVDRVNNYSRTEPNERELININRAVLSTLHLVKSRLCIGVELVTDLHEIPDIYGSLNELKQVVLNLLINALDAIDELNNIKKGMIRISSLYDEREAKIILRIKDNANGIDQDVLNSIFDPFFTTKEVGSGSGLGLHVCHQIIEKHQGQIHVQSELTKGTEFIIFLPVDLRSNTR